MDRHSFLVSLFRYVPVLVLAIALTACGSSGSTGSGEVGDSEGVVDSGRVVDSDDVVHSDGAHGLFIGHSFFVPVAVAFDRLAVENEFSSHQMDSVFAGGAAGAPGALWDDADKRAQIEGFLATGEIDLLGMTAFGGLGSQFEDYANWIDLALAYNPETRFFIGSPWTFGGPTIETATYDQSIETAGAALFEVVLQLREAYPQTRIDYLNYGKAASIMKRDFEAGQLPDIHEMVGLGDTALFADAAMGHAGPMMLEVCALAWMHALYGAWTEELVFGPYESDVQGILAEVFAFNEAAYD
jgi:hypothetical protein